VKQKRDVKLRPSTYLLNATSTPVLCVSYLGSSFSPWHLLSSLPPGTFALCKYFLVSTCLSTTFSIQSPLFREVHRSPSPHFVFPFKTHRRGNCASFRKIIWLILVLPQELGTWLPWIITFFHQWHSSCHGAWLLSEPQLHNISVKSTIDSFWQRETL
jgi:hypothetical protein